jgi:3-hydroxyacyl-CoA dehydrogenase
MVDVREEALDLGRHTIEKDLDRRVRKGRLSEEERRASIGRVSATTSLESCADSPVVIEAVVEDMAVKTRVFGDLEGVVASEAVLATNTSSLSVAGIAAATEYPERVVGMHFFNPVAVLPLVELARTSLTDDATLATAWAVTKKLRKTGVLVRDAPAFVVNRLLGRQGSVIMQALDHGNTVEETDEAVLRMGLPMAPSVLLQLVGPKVANHVRHTLHDAWPERYPLSKTLESLADGGDAAGGLDAEDERRLGLVLVEPACHQKIRERDPGRVDFDGHRPVGLWLDEYPVPDISGMSVPWSPE